MRHVPYVGFMTHRRATVRTCLYLYKKKKKFVTETVRYQNIFKFIFDLFLYQISLINTLI
jgi:hypothetical protein